MHPRIYKEFEEICSKIEIKGSVLEVGAMPNVKSLLNMKSLANASEKIGISLGNPRAFNDFRIIQGNANKMSCFSDESFDIVLCNAMLEHDKFFWKSISEIKRVTKPGGYIVLGTPGYTYYKIEKVKYLLNKTPLINRLKGNQYLNLLFSSTLTFHIHNAPGDYYRFSPQTFKDVFFEDMEEVNISAIMIPPRIIGFGKKK